MKTLFGVNVPYLNGEYGHDLAESGRHPTWPCRFDPMVAYRPLVEARRMGFGAIRMWLCENGEGIRVDERGDIVGVSDRLLESIRVLQEGARLHGLYLYWCLLDGNAWPRENDPITRSILADADQAARFAEHVATPIARVLDPALTLGIDVVNEPESSTRECIADPSVDAVDWSAIGRAIRRTGEAVRAEGEFLVSAGTSPTFLPQLWRSGAELSALDIHVYHVNGGLPSREELARRVEDDRILDPALPLFGGELGIPKPDGPEEPTSLCNYLHNAERLGYAAAFLWQLEGDLIDKSLPNRPRSWLGDQVAHTIAQLA